MNILRLITLTVFVTVGSKQVKLTRSQLNSLGIYSTRTVKSTLANCENGCQIRNNEAADQIFKFI